MIEEGGESGKASGGRVGEDIGRDGARMNGSGREEVKRVREYSFRYDRLK